MVYCHMAQREEIKNSDQDQHRAQTYAITWQVMLHVEEIIVLFNIYN